MELGRASSTLVTARIKEETQPVPPEESMSDDPAFGIRRDREDMPNVAACVHRIGGRATTATARATGLVASRDDGANASP